MAYTLPQPTLAQAGFGWVVARRGASGPLAAFISTWETAQFLLTYRGERLGVGHTTFGWCDMSPHDEDGMTQDALADWLVTFHDDHVVARA